MGLNRTWSVPRPRSLAAGLAAAVVLYTVACLIGERYEYISITPAFWVGVLVGALSAERPYANVGWLLLIALGLGLLTITEGGWFLAMSVPFYAPLLLLGAFAGHGLRRGSAGKG